MLPLEDAPEAISSTLTVLEKQGWRDLLSEGIAAEHIVIERSLDLRYVGQSYELTIPFDADHGQLAQRFHQEHERRFGYCDPSERIQVVNVRLKARGVTIHPELEQQQIQSDTSIEPFMKRAVIFSGLEGPVTYDTPIYERTALKPGPMLTGPAIITQYDTTTVVPPDWRARVDTLGNLIIDDVRSA
jgi:N-methylhydantoinase A